MTAADEYPSNLYPWMNLASHGVALRQVASRDGRIWIEDLAAAVDERTRLLSISHVEFATGFRNDLDALAELCRERGIAFFVDAIQGLGPFVIDVKGTPIDFLAADGHKWLLGPEGAGILFIRREWLERLRATGVGWHSVVGSYNSLENDFVLKPSAGRFEGGSFNMAGLLALGASLSLFLEVGPRVVSNRILDRAGVLRTWPWLAGGVCSARAGGPINRPSSWSRNRASTRREPPSSSRQRGVVASCRRGRLRFSPHLYNDEEDMDRLGAALASLD